MKIKELSIEEICEKINIQANLLDLQSTNKEKIRSALCTLSSIFQLTKRKDCLYSLIGFYSIEVKTFEDIEFFFSATRTCFSSEIAYMIIQDIAQQKDVSKHRLFMNDFRNYLSSALRDAPKSMKEKILELIRDSKWGEKQKTNFLGELYFKPEMDEF